MEQMEQMEHTNPLADVRERMRPLVEAALQDARRELASVGRRIAELEAEIKRAEGWLGLQEQIDESLAGSRMTLHAAMEALLRERGPTPVTELAEEIERRGLYRRKDGKPPGAHQVHARVHNYPEIFVRVSPGVVGLREE